MAVVQNTNSAPSVANGPGWWLIGLALAAMVLLWLAGDRVQVALRYDRLLIKQGEYWRLITGHWVHGSLRHMALNVGGALLIAFLFVRTYSLRSWLWVLGMSTVAIDMGFWWAEPQLAWYVGASGVLHGVLAAGAVAWWHHDWRKLKFLVPSLCARRFRATARLFMRTVSTLALWGVVLGKLAWEQVHGALPLAGDMSVIVAAHLYGAIGGSVTAMVVEMRALFSRRAAQAPL